MKSNGATRLLAPLCVGRWHKTDLRYVHTARQGVTFRLSLSISRYVSRMDVVQKLRRIDSCAEIIGKPLAASEKKSRGDAIKN